MGQKLVMGILMGERPGRACEWTEQKLVMDIGVGERTWMGMRMGQKLVMDI